MDIARRKMEEHMHVRIQREIIPGKGTSEPGGIDDKVGWFQGFD